MECEKEKLEHKRRKLLEAHFADAIPLDLLKSEQDKISKALLDIDNQISIHDTHYDILKDNLRQSFDLLEDCGKAYKSAPDSIKRAYNQAIFEKILVHVDGTVEPEFLPPFDILLDLTGSKISYVYLAKQGEFSIDKNGIKKSPDQNFFDQGFTKKLLVRVQGL